MKIIKCFNENVFSSRNRFSRRHKLYESEVEADVEDEVSADEGDVTITLTPSDISVLKNVLAKVDAVDVDVDEPADEGETCPGCDDPNCPDCNPDVAEEEPADDSVSEFEVPDVSELEDSSKEDELNYFS